MAFLSRLWPLVPRQSSWLAALQMGHVAWFLFPLLLQIPVVFFFYKNKLLNLNCTNPGSCADAVGFTWILFFLAILFAWLAFLFAS